MKHVKTYIIGGLIGSMCLVYTSCDSKLDQVNPNHATEQPSGRMRLILSWHLPHAILLLRMLFTEDIMALVV